MSHVLVTGATGKIGCNTLLALLARGDTVRALVMPDDPTEGRLAQFPSSRLEVVHGDIADEDVAPRVVEGVDRVVHLASNGHFARNDAHFYTTDVNGTYHLMRAAAMATPQVKRVVFASSFVSYGPARFYPLTEDHPQLPNTPLGVVKLSMEKIAGMFGASHGLQMTALRFSWVMAGEDVLNVHFRVKGMLGRLRSQKEPTPERQAGAEAAIAQLARYEADGQERLVVMRDRTTGKSWALHVVDVRDVVQMILLCLDHPQAAGEAFNVCAPAPVTYERGAAYLARALDLPTVEIAVPWLQAEEVSAAKGRALVGYQPKHDFFAMVDSGLAYRRGEDIGIARLQL
jgi:UDP-glucose 4-epimerase